MPLLLLLKHFQFILCCFNPIILKIIPKYLAQAYSSLSHAHTHAYTLPVSLFFSIL